MPSTYSQQKTYSPSIEPGNHITKCVQVRQWKDTRYPGRPIFNCKIGINGKSISFKISPEDWKIETRQVKQHIKVTEANRSQLSNSSSDLIWKRWNMIQQAFKRLGIVATTIPEVITALLKHELRYRVSMYYRKSVFASHQKMILLADKFSIELAKIIIPSLEKVRDCNDVVTVCDIFHYDSP